MGTRRHAQTEKRAARAATGLASIQPDASWANASKGSDASTRSATFEQLVLTLPGDAVHLSQATHPSQASAGAQRVRERARRASPPAPAASRTATTTATTKRSERHKEPSMISPPFPVPARTPRHAVGGPRTPNTLKQGKRTPRVRAGAAPAAASGREVESTGNVVPPRAVDQTEGHASGVRQQSFGELRAALAEGWEIVQPIFARPLWSTPDDSATAFNFVLRGPHGTRLITVPQGRSVERFIRDRHLTVDSAR